jgi:uncharacterized surface protein with fasciclin (FAS1) repeats
MKHLLFVCIALFINLKNFAQPPQKMSYQAVIRNASNEILVNKPIKLRISILQGGEQGNAVYSELHAAITNSNGLVSVEIGSGTSPSGTFSSINWSSGTYYIKTETDPNNGTNYTIIGTSQLLSVPYALYAAKSGNSNITPGNKVGDMLYWNGSTWTNILVGKPGQSLQLNQNSIPGWAGDAYAVVETLPVTDITDITATFNVKLISNGLSSDLTSDSSFTLGLCLDTLPNPRVIWPNYLSDSFSVPGNYLFSTSSRYGSVNLLPNKKYFARAFAENSAGLVYGNEVTFTTLKSENNLNYLYSKINQDSELSKLRAGIDIANLKDTLSKPGAFTFFAPVNSSLDSLGIVINNTSDVSADEINQILRYHIVKGTYRSADIPAGAKNLKVSTINNPADSLFITKAPNGSIYVNGVKVDDAKKDITVGNGVIHKLVNNKATKEYGFLYFPDNQNAYDLIKASTGELDSLAKMIDRAATVDPNLIPVLKNNIVSIAAPINEALVDFVRAFGGDINKIPATVIAAVLKNHITPSREFLINLAIATLSSAAGTPTLSGTKLGYTIVSFDAFGGAQFPALYILKDKPVPIIASDFMCKNGVIHLVYGVILDK